MKDKLKEKKAVVAKAIDSLQTSHFVSLMKGCWDYIVPQRDSLLLFNKSLRNTGRLCMWADRKNKREGEKKPFLCLQQPRLAAEKREEKSGEDCVWNCSSVAVVVLSHFISATPERFPPIYLPSDYSSSVSEQEKQSVPHHGWLNAISRLFFPTHPAHAISSLNITLCLNAFFH